MDKAMDSMNLERVSVLHTLLPRDVLNLNITPDILSNGQV